MILRSINVFYVCLGIILLSKDPAKCNPVINSNFNEHIREFAKDDDFNSSNAKTLLKEDPGWYANFTPIRSPVKFKDLEDSSQSSSSYSRGLVHHDHPGYTPHEYEGPHYEYGTEYHFPEYPHHGIDHHSYGHHGEHHYPDYHKYHHHGLAAKTVLWPIVGLALLGAAAALVTNPILLQIGVASGKRRRRDTEEEEDNIDIYQWKSKNSKNIDQEQTVPKLKIKQRRHFIHNGLARRRNINKNLSQSESSKSINPYKEYMESYSSTPDIDNDRVFIPVPIKIKDVS